MRRSTMKRYFAAVIILTILFSLVGCGNTEKALALKEKEVELELKEKELELKEKEMKSQNEALKEAAENIKKKIESKASAKKVEVKEKVTLSTAQQKEINTFLSNFTEVFFSDYTEEPSNEAMIDFAVRHNDINNPKLMQIKEYSGHLDKTHVERTVKKYFGRTVKHVRTQNYEFDGTNYVIQLADGEMLPMAVVEEMFDHKDGTYTVYFLEAFSFDYLHYGMTPQMLQDEMKKYPDEIEIGNKKKAVVQRHDFEGKSIYKLLEYVTIK
jgi:outer membrane murein-binding lipoprotein Lpp